MKTYVHRACYFFILHCNEFLCYITLSVYTIFRDGIPTHIQCSMSFCDTICLFTQFFEIFLHIFNLHTHIIIHAITNIAIHVKAEKRM